MKVSDLIYLASPYSDPSPQVRHQRYLQAVEVTAALLRKGLHVFSPIVHSHPLAAFGLPSDWDYWRECDTKYLNACSSMIILALDGWTRSRGVSEEIKLCTMTNKPVGYLSPCCLSCSVFRSGGCLPVADGLEYEDQLPVDIGTGMFEASMVVDGVRMYPYVDTTEKRLYQVCVKDS